jgi:hypothetical protein
MGYYSSLSEATFTSPYGEEEITEMFKEYLKRKVSEGMLGDDVADNVVYDILDEYRFVAHKTDVEGNHVYSVVPEDYTAKHYRFWFVLDFLKDVACPDKEHFFVMTGEDGEIFGWVIYANRVFDLNVEFRRGDKHLKLSKAPWGIVTFVPAEEE